MQPKAPEIMATEGVAAIFVNGDHFFVSSTSAVMRAVERTMSDIAATDIPVLVVGESGTGKGAVALRIHQLSRRCHDTFVKMNCAALMPEFFNGHSADGNPSVALGNGTVFLDEVGELELRCQPKLLYALPDGEMMQPEGSPGPRVIAATRRNLEKEMREGRFREDLYYRISGVCLRLPPLRQRKEDIPALVDYFLVKYAALLGRRQPELGAATMRTLLEYSWPGNIRELEYSIQKIIALGDEGVALADLRSPHGEARAEGVVGEGLSLKQAARAASRQAERELILKVLSRTRWNRKRAAQELQISYKALLYKLKQIGVDSAGS